MTTTPPEETAVFSRPARRAAIAYAAATVPVAAVAGRYAVDQGSYLLLWGAVSGLLTFPTVWACGLAAHRSAPDGEFLFWRWLCVANAAMVLSGIGAVTVAGEDVLGLRAASVPVVVAVTLLYMRANYAIMRRRSGARSVGLDAVETAIATTILVGAAVTVAGEGLAALPHRWFTFPAALATMGGVVGLVWAVVLHRRTSEPHRRIETVAVLLAVLTIADGTAQLAQGASDFTLPAAPLLVLQQVTMLTLFLVPLHASRAAVPGLDRLSPQAQVRSSRGVTLIAVVGVPLLGLLALGAAMSGRSSGEWAVINFAGQAAILAVLLALRNLLALDETKRLYQRVAAGAEERQRLIGALARSLDDDRHRVAVQLHQQAIASYTTFSSFIQRARGASPSGLAPLPETSERVQADLGRAAELWREVVLAVRPSGPPARGSAEFLTVAVRAHLMSVLDDEAMPDLAIAVDRDLHLDWATEALVLRIVQEAVAHAHDRLQLARVDLTVEPGAGALDVRLTATGRRAPPCLGTDGDDDSLPAVRSLVTLTHGDLHVEPHPDGLTVRASLGHLGATAAPAPPRLQIVPPLA